MDNLNMNIVTPEVPVVSVPPKKKSVALQIWGVAYPLLGFLALQLIVGILYAIVVMVITTVRVLSQGGDVESLTTAILGAVKGDSFLIPTLIIDILVYRLAVFVDGLDKERYPRTPLKYIRPVDYLLAVVLAVSSSILISSVINGFSLTQYFPDYSELFGMIDEAPLLLKLATVGIAAPLAEEYLMRALVLGRLRKFVPVTAAVVIQAVLFGIIHMNVLQGTYAALVGLLLGFLYVKYNSLAPCIALHIAMNSLSVLIPDQLGLDWNPLLLGLCSLVLVAGGIFFVTRRKLGVVVLQEGTEEARIIKDEDR